MCIVTDTNLENGDGTVIELQYKNHYCTFGHRNQF